MIYRPKKANMAWNRCLSAVLFFLWTGLAASSFISGDVFESRGSTSRTLLQAKKSCPVNFEFLDYKIITSQCKGPQYPANLCCKALKDFACPYAVELNDLTNDCATTMFSYINLYGKYPPGLFASECQDSKRGLECDTPAPTESSDDKSRGLTYRAPFPVLMFTVGFLVLFVQMF